MFIKNFNNFIGIIHINYKNAYSYHNSIPKFSFDKIHINRINLKKICI